MRPTNKPEVATGTFEVSLLTAYFLVHPSVSGMCHETTLDQSAWRLFLTQLLQPHRLPTTAVRRFVESVIKEASEPQEDPQRSRLVYDKETDESESPLMAELSQDGIIIQVFGTALLPFHNEIPPPFVWTTDLMNTVPTNRQEAEQTPSLFGRTLIVTSDSPTVTELDARALLSAILRHDLEYHGVTHSHGGDCHAYDLTWFNCRAYFVKSNEPKWLGRLRHKTLPGVDWGQHKFRRYVGQASRYRELPPNHTLFSLPESVRQALSKEISEILSNVDKASEGVARNLAELGTSSGWPDSLTRSNELELKALHWVRLLHMALGTGATAGDNEVRPTRQDNWPYPIIYCYRHFRALANRKHATAVDAGLLAAECALILLGGWAFNSLSGSLRELRIHAKTMGTDSYASISGNVQLFDAWGLAPSFYTQVLTRARESSDNPLHEILKTGRLDPFNALLFERNERAHLGSPNLDDISNQLEQLFEESWPFTAAIWSGSAPGYKCTTNEYLPIDGSEALNFRHRMPARESTPRPTENALIGDVVLYKSGKTISTSLPFVGCENCDTNPEVLILRSLAVVDGKPALVYRRLSDGAKVLRPAGHDWFALAVDLGLVGRTG